MGEGLCNTLGSTDWDISISQESSFGRGQGCPDCSAAPWLVERLLASEPVRKASTSKLELSGGWGEGGWVSEDSRVPARLWPDGCSGGTAKSPEVALERV